MTQTARIVTCVLVAGLPAVLLVGCRRSEAPAVAASAPAPPAVDSTALPPGHPPVGQAAQGGHGLPAGVGGLRWTKPAGWKEEQPSSGMRQAQYRVAGA